MAGEAQSIGTLQHTGLAAAFKPPGPVLIQYKTPEQELREREDRWNQQREREQEEQRRRDQEDIKRRSTWGAIAYSPSSGRLGFSFDHYFEKQAERDALSECGRSDCEAVTFSDSCRGIAIPNKPASYDWYDGKGQTAEEAEQDAVNVCMSHGEQDCRAIASHCLPQP